MKVFLESDPPASATEMPRPANELEENTPDLIASKRPPVYLTSNGLKKIQDELEFLKQKKVFEVAERIHQARELGGLEENSELDDAVQEQSQVESRIATLEAMLKNVSLIKENHQNIVSLGSTVVLEMDGEKKEFTIVGKFEANPLKKRISNESPIGIALLGAQIGQSVQVKTPAVTYLCKVLEIE